ncbi:hypothetical protein [Candidatus Accumulibacter phosphatis]|uniref:hypothetical protein n=1 Tax=Candidatus Accumulibacter phosphatis TaxID=327160 RepID=UPI0030140370
MLALELDFDDLPRISALDAFEDHPQRQHLTGFERLTRTIVVAAVTVAGTAGADDGTRPREEQRSNGQ